jgi:type I restriction enzyme R subunit/putative DNA methylase
MDDPNTPKQKADGDVGAPKGWYSRGYLPHCDVPQSIQSITFRLADSLPQTRLAELKDDLERLPESERELERRRRIEAWLDAGMGCCALKHPDVARYVQDSILYFHEERYHLHAWCIMPNHVHVLIEPFVDLGIILQGWKSYTSRWILRKNEQLALKIPTSDQLWLKEYWDRFIRSEAHYHNAVEYIHQNPVKAGLCRTPPDWLWSSANPRNANPRNANPGSAYPGSADVPVGTANSKANDTTDTPKKRADGDVGAPRNGTPMEGTPGTGDLP